MADDPARLAGRRRDRAARRSDGARGARAGRARAIQAVFAAFGFPAIGDEEVALATTCLDSRDLPDRIAPPTSRRRSGPRRGDRRARRRAGTRTGRIRRTSPQRSSPCSASASPPTISRRRRSSTRRERSCRRSTTRTSTRAGHGLSAVRRALGPAATAAPRRRRALLGGAEGTQSAEVVGEAAAGDTSDDVVIAVGPAFGTGLLETIGGLPHGDVLEALIAGVREEGASPRLVRIRRSADVASSATTAPSCPGRDRGGRPVEGHRADPPGGPRAARLPRAVRHGSLADRSSRTARSAATRPATRSAGRSPRPDDARQLRAREAHRAHDVAPRAGGGRGHRRRLRRSSSR